MKKSTSTPKTANLADQSGQYYLAKIWTILNPYPTLNETPGIETYEWTSEATELFFRFYQAD